MLWRDHRQNIGRWSRDRRAVAWRRPNGHLHAIVRKVFFIHTARSLSDHLRGIPRRPNGERPICGSFFPPDFGRWPTGPRQMFGRRPVGRRQMHKWPQTSAGHPANFNCELNLPDDRWTSTGWVLYRRITAGFLPDLMQKSPRGDLMMDLALFGRRLNRIRTTISVMFWQWTLPWTGLMSHFYMILAHLLIEN